MCHCCTAVSAVWVRTPSVGTVLDTFCRNETAEHFTVRHIRLSVSILCLERQADGSDHDLFRHTVDTHAPRASTTSLPCDTKLAVRGVFQ